MSVEEELARLSPTRDTMLTIGVFDGVHLGHKKLLSELVKQAEAENRISGVITFCQHPQSLLDSQSDLQILTSLPQKIKLLKDEGIEIVIALNFTLELAQIGIQQFIGLLKWYLKMRGLVVGPDFAMGRSREGNIDALHNLKKSMGFSLSVIPPVKKNGELVSSTNIRKALSEGDIYKVNAMLGRHFSLEGCIISGSGRGEGLGFPTANVDTNPTQALPADGVYATVAYIDGKPHQSITNIGKRPTFNETERTVEVHIIDYNDKLYHQNLKVDIIERIRGEKRFDTVDELINKIAEDINEAKSILVSLED